ncbi:hypothetical protein HNY73_015844 [Argiope bruennichi]|uniref:Uncharacterized protein n=1 Tax=Argiope bruennichi TaxID=94029 RepID=A0A8T0EI21_ARGBR|nr:hypothetical protein HNY73_015844 [Argiope bruennichi]
MASTSPYLSSSAGLVSDSPGMQVATSPYARDAAPEMKYMPPQSHNGHHAAMAPQHHWVHNDAWSVAMPQDVKPPDLLIKPPSAPTHGPLAPPHAHVQYDRQRSFAPPPSHSAALFP